MNGWQRLWIVAAAITLAWAVLYAFSGAAKRGSTDYQVLAALKDPDCEHIRTLPEGFELKVEPHYGSSCYPLYAENKYADSPVRSATEYEAKVSRQFKRSLLIWMGAALVIWALGVAFLYGAGATAAWVRRGFRGGAQGRP